MMIQRILPRRRPLIVRRVGGDSGLAFGDHPPPHTHAERVGAGREHWIDIRLHRIHIRRDEDTTAVGTLLMNVVDDGWRPRRVQRIKDHPLLHLRERIPVTVVVVARVVVIDLRRLRAFRRRAERLPIPIAHDVDAVGVLTGYQHDDRFLQNLARFGRVAANQSVRDDQRRRKSAHFRRVNARCDEHDIATVGEQAFAVSVGAFARIEQLLLDLS